MKGGCGIPFRGSKRKGRKILKSMKCNFLYFCVCYLVSSLTKESSSLQNTKGKKGGNFNSYLSSLGRVKVDVGPIPRRRKRDAVPCFVSVV